MRRESHVRFCEGAGVKFPRATRRNVYVRSQRAGQRVMAWLVRAYGNLRLQINPVKSAVARATSRSFLGFAFWVGPGRQIRRRVAPEALAVMKDRVRHLTGRSRGRSLEQIAGDLRAYLPGWKAYFRLADTPNVLRELDAWIRHRLRALQLKHWKRGRTIFRELRARGMSVPAAARVAANARRWWRNSALAIHIALPNKLFDELGVPRLAA